MDLILVYTKDNGIVDLSTFPCRSWVKELISNRIFDHLEDVQNILRVVDVSKEAYDKGLGCPKDAKTAIKLITSAPKFTVSTAVYTSEISGKDLYDRLHVLLKKKEIVTYDNIHDPDGTNQVWFANVVNKIIF